MKGRKVVKKNFFAVLLVVSMMLSLTGCFGPSLPLRSDMSIDGLDQVVTYNLRGPAGSEQEVNYAQLRGLNEISPLLQQETIFGKMSGSKTQDVQVTLEDGSVVQALGMVKTKRFAGLTHFMTLESSTYTGTDVNGNIYAGAKIRLDFNRNFAQYFDSDKRDFQSLWYYDIPCQKNGETIELDLSKAKLRALVVNEVWQARIATGSFFFNWGHSVTAVEGLPATMPGGWWLNWDIPNKSDDTMGAYDIVNSLVDDLEDSQQPWLEFSNGGSFDESGTYLIYSAGDADQYANFDRIFLNRQKQYSVFYRPDKETAWDYIIVKPVYNYEFNDAGQNLAKLSSWGDNPFDGRLDENGLPKNIDSSVIAEMEKIGWMNAPNASLEQIQFIDSNDQILYTMTVRAYIGANDSLIMFSPTKPEWSEIQSNAPETESLPMPVYYDDEGKKMETQPYTDEQWAEWQREATIWNFMKSNPYCVNADLFVQYRFTDNTTWKAITDGDGHTIGYSPVEWNLSASYYLDGDARKAWLICQLLGEVGTRTLGLSYCSGRYEGTGMLFALAQQVHRSEFFDGYLQESIWRFDARASQLPGTLAEAWSVLHNN
ncbi:MAG: hypothetical protein WDA13_02145 [Candidatus Shapirobacteria bacterium]